MKEKINQKNFLKEIFENPAKIHEGFKYFRGYSIMNQCIAQSQLGKAEPINTYKGWLAVGRQVKKGAKAIELRMPVFKKGEEGEEDKMFFIFKKNWFGLSATEGADYVMPELPNFDKEAMLATLRIKEIEFEQMDGNTWGYAIPTRQEIAISKLSPEPFKTLIHEVAHCLLHSKEAILTDSLVLGKDLKEFEAEATAYLVNDALGLAGGEYQRGYIQAWINQDEVKEANVSRVFSAASKILKAGFGDNFEKTEFCY